MWQSCLSYSYILFIYAFKISNIIEVFAFLELFSQSETALSNPVFFSFFFFSFLKTKMHYVLHLDTRDIYINILVLIQGNINENEHRS